MRHSVYPIQDSLLGLLITFANNFHFNLVAMFVYFVNQSSVIKWIYSEQLVSLYKLFAVFLLKIPVKENWKDVVSCLKG